jgi:hypothetical protein
MRSEPARELIRLGAHTASELAITALQAEAHREFDVAASAERWNPLERFLGHVVILGIAIAGRSVIHAGIDAALAPVGS